MNIEPKLNKSENYVENTKINLSPIKKEKKDIIPNEQLGDNYSPIKLDFYALGKAEPLPEINNPKNNYSFRSSSNNLLIRNYYSINCSKLENLKEKKTKKLATVFHQDIDNNDYLEPFKPFKSNHRYDIPSNSINKGMYNLTKKKLYIEGQESKVNKGKQITKIDFLHKKQKLIDINYKKIYPSTERNSSIKIKFIDKIKEFTNPLNIKEKKIEEKENNCDNLVLSKFKNTKLSQSLSSNVFKPIYPFNSQIEKLKKIDIHFKRNNNKTIRSRNWWKVE